MCSFEQLTQAELVTLHHFQYLFQSFYRPHMAKTQYTIHCSLSEACVFYHVPYGSLQMPARSSAFPIK